MTERRSILLAVLLLCSCSSSRDDAPVVQSESAPSYARSWSGSASTPPETTALERALHGGLTVPPDRGLAMLEARLEASDRAGAVRAIRRVARELAAISSAQESCSIEPWAFGPVERQDDGYTASAELRLDVTLIGAETIEARQDRVEACLGALDRLDPERFQDVRVRLSEFVPTIDDPSQHRGALLERRLASLHAVAAFADAPPQFRAETLRCTSSGEVRIERRSLRGIDLALDFTCAGPASEAVP